MSLLTDDEKRAIFDQIESGKDTPWFERYANAIESAVLAKLAVMELQPLPPHEVEEWSESGITFRGAGWTEETVRALQRQAYAQGAASQLSAEPVTWAVESSKKGVPTFGKGWMFSPVQHLNAKLPLFTRKDPS